MGIRHDQSVAHLECGGSDLNVVVVWLDKKKDKDALMEHMEEHFPDETADGRALAKSQEKSGELSWENQRELARTSRISRNDSAEDEQIRRASDWSLGLPYSKSTREVKSIDRLGFPSGGGNGKSGGEESSGRSGLGGSGEEESSGRSEGGDSDSDNDDVEEMTLGEFQQCYAWRRGAEKRPWGVLRWYTKGDSWGVFQSLRGVIVQSADVDHSGCCKGYAFVALRVDALGADVCKASGVHLEGNSPSSASASSSSSSANARSTEKKKDGLRIRLDRHVQLMRLHIGDQITDRDFEVLKSIETSNRSGYTDAVSLHHARKLVHLTFLIV
jgi:hypothetical protein